MQAPAGGGGGLGIFLILSSFFYNSKTVFLLPYLATFTSSPLDGVSRIFFLHGYATSYNFSCPDPFISYAQGGKPFGLELESKPGPLASQTTALTT